MTAILYAESATTDLHRPFMEVEPGKEGEVVPQGALVKSEEGNISRRYYGQHPLSGKAISYLVIWYMPSSEELFVPPERAVENTSLSIAPWRYPEPDPSVWRGVFSPPHRRKVLFTQQFEFRTTDLPRWRPHICLDPRTLSREEDD